MKPFFSLFFVTVLSAQTPADSAAGTTISGRVLDADTSAAISGALIKVRWATGQAISERVVLSNESGSFQILNAKPPGYGLKATARGYIQHPFKSSVYAEPIAAGVIGPIKATLYLRREAVIEGLVVDETGAPIAGSINVYRNYRSPFGVIRTGVDGVRVNSDGRFSVHKLDAKEYWVHFVPKNKLLPAGIAIPSVYYPDPSGTRAVRLAPGQKYRIDLRLPREKGYVIKGKVLAKGTRHMVDLLMAGENSAAAIADSVECDAAGAFAINNIPSGTYVLSARLGGGSQKRIARKKITVGPTSPVAQVILEAPPVRQITGRVIRESGEAVTTRCCNVELSGLNFISMQWDSQTLGLTPLSLNEGSYRLSVNSQDYPILSVRQGTINALNEGILIPSTGPVPPIEIVIGPRNPSVTMVAAGSTPLWVDLLRVTPQGYEVAGVASHMAIPVGYTINAQAIRLNAYPITPGRYYLFARSPSLSFSLPLDDPQFVDKYRHLANLVTISQEDDQTITLTKILTSESFNEPTP